MKKEYHEILSFLDVRMEFHTGQNVDFPPSYALSTKTGMIKILLDLAEKNCVTFSKKRNLNFW